MNREIIFRGKRVNGGEWVYGDLLHIAGGYIIYHGSQKDCEITTGKHVAVELLHNEISVVVPETVGQFTGLFDKNGKEIVKVGGIISPLQPGAKTQFNTSMTLDYANTYDFKIELKK